MMQCLAFYSPSQFLFPVFFARRFLGPPCKIVVYLLTKGRDHSHCLSDKERLNNGREMTVLCGSASFFMQEYSHWNAWRNPWFWWRPAALWNWAALVLGTKKSEVISVFCHWCSLLLPPQLSLDSCGLLPTVLWACLFLNKWVYDSDFLLPLPSLSLIWNSTHPSERAQSGCCLCLLYPLCNLTDRSRRGGASPPYEKPVATPMLSRAWIFVQILH